MSTRRLLAEDVRLSGRLQALGDRSRLLRAAAIPLARSADGWPWVVGTLLVAAVGEAELRRQALWIATTIVVTGIAVKIVKAGVRRARPPGEWGGAYRRNDPHAFPSGHSARAFLLAAFACALGPVWLGAATAVWATLVAASRVVLGVHYLSDVGGGALLGLGCGILALSL